MAAPASATGLQNTGTAVALFERSGLKLKATSYMAVSQSAHYGKLLSTFALRPY